LCASQLAISKNIDQSKQTNNMKKSTVLLVTLCGLLAFGLQAVKAQSNLNGTTKDVLEAIADVKALFEKGTLTKDNWDENRSYVDYIKDACILEKREAAIKIYSMGGEAEKKALEAAYVDFAKFVAKKGLTFEKENNVGNVMETNPAYKAVQEDIKKMTGYMSDPAVGSLNTNQSEQDWLVRAVSKKARAEWAGTFLASSPQTVKTAFNADLDKLAAAAAKSLPGTKPQAANFLNRNAAEEELMMGEMTSNLKVHKIGIASKTWKIQKNDLDIPQKRFKTGYLWIKNPADDHPYCKLCQVSVIQDYNGGGTYGDSYATFLACWIVGCP
jgi:hypothetical protein